MRGGFKSIQPENDFKRDFILIEYDYPHAVLSRLISTDYFLIKKLRKRLPTDYTDLHRLFRLIIFYVDKYSRF